MKATTAAATCVFAILSVTVRDEVRPLTIGITVLCAMFLGMLLEGHDLPKEEA